MAVPWAAPDGYRCDRCIWGQMLGGEEPELLCRKPLPVLKDDGLRGHWPVVAPHDYCGQFTPRVEEESR